MTKIFSIFALDPKYPFSNPDLLDRILWMNPRGQVFLGALVFVIVIILGEIGK